MAIVALDAAGEERTAIIARVLAAEGATVILVTGGGDEGGRLASVLRQEAGGRVAVFCAGSDPAADVEALAELAAELAPRP
jgi:NAD(P)-dependent dehydrogenase (short-subunit alcohol dehydrogenase family)